MAPKQIVNKSAEATQMWVYIFGTIAALASWGNFANDAGGAGILLALVAIVLFVIATNIKTTYHHQGGIRTDIYAKKEPDCGWSYGIGLVSALIAWGAFSAGSGGAGFLFLMGSLVFFFWVPSLMKPSLVRKGSHTRHYYK